MKRQEGAQYLGTGINAKADPAREVNRRLVLARSAEDKLRMFWREGKVSQKWKILMFNAIVGTKLIYGLEVHCTASSTHSPPGA